MNGSEPEPAAGTVGEVITRCPHGWLLPETELTCLDDAEVVLRCERDPSVSVRFAERHAAAAPQDRRLFFVDGLDFRGWQGEQRWANADRDLEVVARFESGGHVELTWTLRPWRSAYGGWDVTIVTWLEAGAAKDDLAARLDAFLTAEGFPVDYYESDNEFT